MFRTTAEVFSPWFPRQADVLRVTAECVAVSGARLTVRLYSKNENATTNFDGADVDALTALTLSSEGRSAAEWVSPSPPRTGVKQLLRFGFAVSGSSSTDWIRFRILGPVWFDAL